MGSNLPRFSGVKKIFEKTTTQVHESFRSPLGEAAHGFCPHFFGRECQGKGGWLLLHPATESDPKTGGM